MELLSEHNKTAIIFRDERYSYAQLLQRSVRYGRAFAADGTPQKILIFAENSPAWIFAFYGSVRCGAITVPVDCASTVGELAYILNDCRPEIIFTSSAKRAVVEQAFAKNDFSCRILTESDIDLQDVDNEAITPVVFDNDERTMLIIYTSGTTGSPKGVMLSYKNAMFNVHSVSRDVPIFTPERNTMILLPLHHAFPLMGSLVAPLYMGQTVAMADGLNADSILKTLVDGRINIIIGVPRLYELLSKGIMAQVNASRITRAIFKLMQKIGSPRLSRRIFAKVHKKFGGHIDYLVSGGAALPTDIGRIFKTLGFTVLEGYGMTETAPMISFTRPWNVQVGYAGEPLPNIEVKIDENGEVCVRGDNVMQGYYNRPDETADIIRDGWLHTGDMGELSPTKGLKLTGRIKEIIVTPNGKNINPAEVEEAIERLSPCVKEVGVFLKDSVLQCVIVPQLSAVRDHSNENMHDVLRDEIARYNQSVAPYKRIKKFHIVSGELPKTRLMKLQRFKLAELVDDHKKTATDDTTPRSEIYLALKAYIDKETDSNAGENDDFEIDLAMDSLGKVALLTFVESRFGVNLNEAQLDQLSTLAKLSDYIEKNGHQTDGEAKKVTWKEILTNRVQNFVVPRAGVIQAFCSRTVSMLIGLTYRGRNQRKIKLPQQPCIIVANHRSMLDGYFITSKMRGKTVRNTFFFAKDKHLRGKLAHFLASKNNVILMDINKNVRESLQQMAAVLGKGKNIIIFPEGTRSKTGKMLAFKDSFAILSKELNVPVAPVAICGSERAVLKRIKLPRLFAKITVDFLPPIYPENLTVEQIRTSAEQAIACAIKN